MKNDQRVYIRGNSERGSEVIKTLEDLGGKNLHSYLGTDTTSYYFIDPNGVIDTTPPRLVGVFLYIKEFYKEIKLPRWKPKNGECYYFIDDKGTIITSMWNKYGERKDNLRYELGNCFRTPQEAEVARDNIKELLNNR